MPAPKKILAFDLGAESGRGLLGLFDGSKLHLEVIHRFSNNGVRTLDSIHWDVLHLYQEMINTLRQCALNFQHLDSIGIDTWGVDFGLLGRDGNLLGNPRHYRDPHTEGVMEEAIKKVPREEIFQKTGAHFIRFNSVFQLLAMQRDSSPILDSAETLLFIPDLFNYWFTGVKVNEFTDATTSQMLDPASRTWAVDLVQKLGLPDKILGTIVPPGTVLGPLRSTVATETGLVPTPVIAPATHDTGSAVAAVPAAGKNYAYISSGTWSLMGAELDAPLVTPEAHQYNFTNEGGVGGTIRFLKNIMGLWLVQECRRTWQKAGKEYGYEELTRMAASSTPFQSLVNPDDMTFMLPPSMPDALADFCKKTNQQVPQDPGTYVRCCLESLALRYRWVVEKLEKLLGKKMEAIHVVGGGCQNTLLCQLTADACNLPVYAGPVEATAIGNVLIQAIALGLLGSLEEGREVVRQSFEFTTYTPQNPERWQEPYERFLSYL